MSRMFSLRPSVSVGSKAKADSKAAEIHPARHPDRVYLVQMRPLLTLRKVRPCLLSNLLNPRDSSITPYFTLTVVTPLCIIFRLLRVCLVVQSLY